jgi:hypothetical protein
MLTIPKLMAPFHSGRGMTKYLPAARRRDILGV